MTRQIGKNKATLKQHSQEFRAEALTLAERICISMDAKKSVDQLFDRSVQRSKIIKQL